MAQLKNARLAVQVDDLQRQVAALEHQVKAKDRAHEKTLEALQKARATPRAPKITPRRKRARLKSDEIEVITGDWHGNQVDPTAFAAFLADLKQIRPHRLFLGGDIINCGGFLAEHHTLGYVAEGEDSYEQDIEAANRLLDQAAEAAGDPDTHYLEGNHEWRVERWVMTAVRSHHRDREYLRRAHCAEHTLRLADRKITYYRQGHTHPGCNVPGWVHYKKLYYVHKVSNARNAADVAVGKAAANICYFDTHRPDFKPRQLPGSGIVAAWNPGCLCLRQPLFANTRPTEWIHGYLVRFISRTGKFSIVNQLIDGGQSFGDLMFNRRPAKT